MLKSFYIVAIFSTIFMLFAPVFVQATEVNMNLTANTSVQNTASVENTTTTIQNSIAEPEVTSDTLTPNQTTYSDTTTTVNSLNQLPESNLGLTNVINIILIVIGVLLVLLGIAIIIRLKH